MNNIQYFVAIMQKQNPSELKTSYFSKKNLWNAC